MRHLFRFLVRLGRRNGEIISPSERIDGVSIWIPSERAKSSALTALQAGLLALYFRAGRGPVSRLIEVGTKKGEVRDSLRMQPHCLLDMIGVEPSLQKRGIGRRMIEDKLTELDGQGVLLPGNQPRRDGEVLREFRLSGHP